MGSFSTGKMSFHCLAGDAWCPLKGQPLALLQLFEGNEPWLAGVHFQRFCSEVPGCAFLCIRTA